MLFQTKKNIWYCDELWSNAAGDALPDPSSDKNAKQISDFGKNLVYSINISAQTNNKILIFFQKIRRVKLYKNCINQIPTDLHTLTVTIKHISFIFFLFVYVVKDKLALY